MNKSIYGDDEEEIGTTSGYRCFDIFGSDKLSGIMKT